MNRVNRDNRKEKACTWHSSYISCFMSSVGAPRCGWTAVLIRNICGVERALESSRS